MHFLSEEYDFDMCVYVCILVCVPVTTEIAISFFFSVVLHSIRCDLGVKIWLVFLFRDNSLLSTPAGKIGICT